MDKQEEKVEIVKIKWDGQPVPPEQWGRDHFSTLLYVEDCAVNNSGIISHSKLRRRHSGYPTLLKDGVRLHGHGDEDCLDDMEHVGLLTWSFSALVVTLTDKGWWIAGLLRRNRAETHSDAKFVYPVEDEDQDSEAWAEVWKDHIDDIRGSASRASR